MRPTRYFLCLLICSAFTISAMAQGPATDSTGLPGDNFSLQGALQMFQKAGSPEEFEKILNAESNHVNNLDLNGDGEIDYVRVVDMKDRDVHVFVLQVPVSETENQDIAVIELEKTGDASAIVQIVGDEDIYGERVIVEPGSEEEGNAFIYDDKNDIAHGPSGIYPSATTGIIINVWFWPTVRYVYAPGYAIWRSPWRWRHYPAWWRPWRPMGWHAFYPLRGTLSPAFCSGSYAPYRIRTQYVCPGKGFFCYGKNKKCCVCKRVSCQQDEDYRDGPGRTPGDKEKHNGQGQGRPHPDKNNSKKETITNSNITNRRTPSLDGVLLFEAVCAKKVGRFPKKEF